MVQPALHGWVQGVKRLVHMSHLNARAKPEQAWLPGGSRWLATKYQGELAVRAEFPEATIFRPSDVYGQVLCLTSQHCLYLTAVQCRGTTSSSTGSPTSATSGGRAWRCTGRGS